MSHEDIIDAVKLELAELKSLGAITAKAFAGAMRYVTTNEDEIVAAAEYSSVSDVADMAVACAAACSTGRCD